MHRTRAEKRIRDAVQQYTGWKRTLIELYADPFVPGIYAVQAINPTEKKKARFLFNVVAANRSKLEDWECLEEVDYSAWPPERCSNRVGMWDIRW